MFINHRGGVAKSKVAISLMALVPCLAVLAFGTSAALAAECPTCAPWWGVSTGARPTSLQPGAARDEVQEILTSPQAGFQLHVHGNEPVELNGNGGRFATEPYFAAFGGLFAQATTANIRKAIEGVYGENVVVTGDLEKGEPLVVRSPSQKVEHLEVSAFPGFGSAEAKLLSEGQSDGQVIVTAQNRGDAPTSGTTTIVDQLPPGLEAVAIQARAGGTAVELPPVHCVLGTLTCTFEGALPSYEAIEVQISVVVKAGAKDGGENAVSVSGGGARAAASASHRIGVGGPLRFGVEDYELLPENIGGSLDTQAGSHPFQLTNVVTLNTQTNDQDGHPRTVALAKDIIAELPPGFLGNPTPFERCTDAQFAKGVIPPGGGRSAINECPAASAVGVASVSFTEPGAIGFKTSTAPIFNLTPRKGEPVRFGFLAGGVVSVFLDGSVRTGGDYGVTISSTEITEAAATLGVKLTFWGVPGAPAHDNQRGWACLEELGECPTTDLAAPPPFLVMPTSCAAPFRSTVQSDSWAAGLKASEVGEPVTYSLPAALDGCNQLPFEPSIKVSPDGNAGSTPSGLTVDVHVPQEAVLNAESLAESAVKGISVTLPEGVVLNPASADGLQACSQAQVGLGNDEEASCPDASKIGKVTIHTPLLPNPLEGFVYLASPQNFAGIPENPFSSLIAMYLVAKDPVSGVLVKLAGHVSLSASGQISTTFENNPQLPFEDASLEFFGGDRAPLATPARCGTYVTNATYSPWAENGVAQASGSFAILSGPHGSACPNPQPFDPSLTSGSTSDNAGTFSPLTTTISREDGNQNIRSVQLHYPPGVSGILAHVPLCQEAQANAGTCGPESLIGETIVSVGLGGDPFSVTGGKVYLTEKYAGAPFGLSIVNPAKAGPFDLQEGRPVVVRAKIEVDPHTAALTITTDSSGTHAIPSIIEGIPLQIKHVNVLVNRPGFTFNPTNCSPQQVTGTVTSTEGASSPVSVPFQVTNCAALKFALKFSVSTSGKTSKAKGASLHVKLTYPQGPMGTYANIARVKVDLPKQLPSQLKTLQKACTAAQFEANPAGCPAASKVGYAKAVTPLIPVPLEGPAIFVSHGNEAFPSLIVVLQGYGVTIDLVGSTFISKAGITSSTFKTVPDQPIGSFELTLPQGKYSALAANGGLCTQKLVMPTEFVGQNGAQINQSTPIEVEGCSNTLSFISHKIKKRTLTVSVYAPAPGKLTIGGKGLKSVSKTVKQRGDVTFKVKQKKAGKLKTMVKATFTPSTGKDRKKQTKALKVTFRK